MTAPAGTGLARVTVTTPTRRIDVALPEDVPVVELLPDVLRHAGEDAADDGERHGGWVLRRATGTLLEGTSDLGSQGVRDGEVLHLVPRRTEWPEPEYDDVVEAIASGARRYGRSWGGVATRRCALAVTAGTLVLGLANLLRADPPWIEPGLVAIGLAVVLAVVGVVLARAGSDAVAGATVAASGLPYGFAGGVLVALPDSVSIPELGAPQVLAGSASLLFLGLVGYVGVAAVNRLFAAAMAAGLMGVVAGLLGFTSLSGPGIAAIVVTLAIGLLPGYPLLSIRIGKLPLPTLPQRAEELLRDEPVPRRADVFAAVARSDEVLTGILLAVAVVSVVSGAVLVGDGGRSAVALTAIVAFALLLRARLFPTPRQRLPLLAGGLGCLVLLGQAASAVAASNLAQMLLLAGLVLVAASILTAGLLYSRRPPSPYLGRFADIADVLLIVALVPVTCILVGFYDYVRDVFASLG